MPGDNVVKSVGRVFAVLELFDQAQTALAAADVERRLDYPQSSTLALLKSMVALGYLAYDRVARTYTPTIRVSMLGRWISESDAGLDLQALIDEIRDATGETVSLTAQNDLQMQFLRISPGRNPLTVNIHAGTTGPLFGSNMGMVALAQLPDGEIRLLAERINRSAAPEGAVDLAGAMRQIRSIRKNGYSVGLARYVPSIGALAWPLPSDGRTRPLVLSVAGPIEAIRKTQHRIIEVVGDILSAHGCLP